MTSTWDATGFRAAVQTSLDAFVSEQALRLAPLGDDAGRLVEAAHAAVSGGKRFRAAFCYWGFRAAGTDVPDEASLVRAAAALELLHASALVHDDYMDASDTRRGRPATHKAFEARHRERLWTGNAEQYGAAAAILLGDLLLAWSDELLRRCGLPADVVGHALDFFDVTRSEVIAGQFLDVSVQARGASDVEQAMRVLRYKSAKYSIERPLHVGAALAGADAATLEAADPVRAAARRGVPAPRRPARGVRRPGGDRQARRRRPHRGQADRAGRAGAPGRRRPTDATRLDPALGTPCRRRRSPTCAGSSTAPAPTPRWSDGSRSSPPAR